MTMTRFDVVAVTAFAGIALNCSTAFSPRPCKVDSDCGAGLVCELKASAPVCQNPTDATIRLGMSAPISGTSAQLGINMRAGIELAINEQNSKGGVRGRQIKLEFRDDGYEPPNAEAAARELLEAVPGSAPPRCPETSAKSLDTNPEPVSRTLMDRGPNAVLGLIGNVGTPTMVRAAPVALETKSLYFGAFTGAGALLRDGRAGPECSRYVFNVRASYAQEARAALEMFVKKGVRDSKHLISFDQNDTFGDAGFNGLTKAYGDLSGDATNQLPPAAGAIARYRYRRNDVASVGPVAQQTEDYLRALLAADSANHVVGVLMTDTYSPGAAFISALRDWLYANDAEQTTLKKRDRLTLYFNNVSFVGPNALAGALVDATQKNQPVKPYTDNVFVTQVVPNYDTDPSEIARTYKALAAGIGLTPGFTSFEGYIAARIFIAGLLNTNGPVTPESMITALETMPDLALGLGGAARYTTTSHNYLKSIWVTEIQPDSRFVNRYYWTDRNTTQIGIDEF